MACFVQQSWNSDQSQRKVLTVKRTRATLAIVALLWGCIGISAAAQTEIKIVRPSQDVDVPSGILQKLSAADTEAFLVLSNRDAILVYDTVRDKPDTADFMDNHPHVAVFSQSGAVAVDIDALALAPSGPIRFDGMAIMPVSDGTPLLACAFTLGVDGAGTFFVFVGQESGTYKVLATLQGAQAQLRLNAKSPERFEFWTADGQFSRNPDKQCVWCPKHYKTKLYAWRNQKLTRLSESKSSRGYDPETFDDRRFMVK